MRWRRIILRAARRPWAVSCTPRYGTCSISPVSESRFTIPLTDGGATRSTPAMSRVEAKPPWLERIDRLRSEEHTSELQSRLHLVCRLLLEKKKTDTERT